MTDRIRALAHRMYTAFNDHDHAAALDIFTPDFYSHAIRKAGPQSIVDAWSGLHQAFPDARVTVEDVIVEGETVAARLTMHGIAGEPATMLEMYRVRDGRIAELWALTSLRRDT